MKQVNGNQENQKNERAIAPIWILGNQFFTYPKLKVILPKIASYLLLTVLACLFIAPILFTIVGSLKPDELVLAESGTIKAFIPARISFQNYRDVFDRVNFTRFFLKG
jgi:ABC-type glycerol-3-phosphate transport system permease component